MNFEQMEYIKEVVDTKSMSLAAQNLHVSQSAISIAFQSLHYQGGIKVIVPMDSPLAFYNELTVKDIIDYPFVMYASRYWENLTGYIQEHIGPINIMFETTNTEVIKKTVSEGLGISLLSSLMLLDDPYVESQRIAAIPLADYSLFQNFSFGWIHSKNHPICA